MNFITAPLIADLFLLAILAIGREEIYGGTVGSNNIAPIDIMVFFLTLAYIAISIDASGIIRFLALKVLQWGGVVGHRLFFYLYSFFFILGSFIGNDPIILSGTAFLAYMTRVSSNIEHPRAWIHTQFAIANIASTILVSSNPTNLVLAGAFKIKFIDYTANMIVPVVATAILLFPCLLYIIFANERLIPISIKMHEIPEEIRSREPVNPNIPNARGAEQEEEEESANDEEGKILSLEEIMNPFVDRAGAAAGALIMAATLITVLALNAASTASHEPPVFWVTLPAAFVMFCWDLAFGWMQRHETRSIARQGREEIENARAERLLRRQERQQAGTAEDQHTQSLSRDGTSAHIALSGDQSQDGDSQVGAKNIELAAIPRQPNETTEAPGADRYRPSTESQDGAGMLHESEPGPADHARDVEGRARNKSESTGYSQTTGPSTLTSVSREAYRWCQETFPTVIAVFSHLPFALVPFALTMFVLVEALVTKGWVPVFAYGWHHWVNKTGTIGAIGGMGFLSVILCNVSNTSQSHRFHVTPTVRCAHSLLVCRYEYWHYYPIIPCGSSVAGNPREQRRPHIRPDLLGHGIQHGTGRQLRRLQHGIQRVAGGPPVAGYPRPETHQSAATGVCPCQPPHHRHIDDGRLRGPHRRGLHHEERYKPV